MSGLCFLHNAWLAWLKAQLFTLFPSHYLQFFNNVNTITDCSYLLLPTGAVFNLLCGDRDEMLMSKIERYFNSQVKEVILKTAVSLFMLDDHKLCFGSPRLFL